MLVAALLHDYNPMHDIKFRKSHSRIPRVINTLEEIRKREFMMLILFLPMKS